MFYSQRWYQYHFDVWILVRVKISNCISRLFWFGTGLPVFKKCEAYFLKEAKAAALQELRPDCHREGGKSNEFKSESKYHRVFANNSPNPMIVIIMEIYHSWFLKPAATGLKALCSFFFYNHVSLSGFKILMRLPWGMPPWRLEAIFFLVYCINCNHV